MSKYGLYFGWLVAIVATGGSLYFSEVMGFVPCSMCWIQRIFMYPLVIILGIASFHFDFRMAGYVLPLTIIGGLFSVYHVMEQNIPAMQAYSICQVGVSCSGKYINWLGFISIPVLALIAFTLITIFMIASLGESKEEDQEPAIEQ